MTLEGLNDDFRDLLVELADAGVEFVVVGAFALAFSRRASRQWGHRHFRAADTRMPNASWRRPKPRDI
jgi:hypothetical protein